jgi:hypothetical protein
MNQMMKITNMMHKKMLKRKIFKKSDYLIEFKESRKRRKRVS